MKKFYMRFFLIVFVFSVSILSASAQTTILVTNANDAGAGSLRAAVSSAVAGDTIRIDGTSSNFSGKGITTITLATGVISFSANNLVFKGFYNAAGDTVKVSGNHASGIISTSAPTMVTVDSMYLIDGSSAGNGGAVYNSAGAVTISNSTISGNNSAAFNTGGGVSTNGGSDVIIINSRFSGNTARAGGSVYARNVTVTNSTISGNTATLGGGIYARSGTVTITNSTISGNTATTSDGGGVNTDNVNINNSTITGNMASDGGGIFAFNTAIITNSTISRNTATYYGGVDASSFNITESIVALNSGGDLSKNTVNTDGGYNIFTDIPAGTVSTDQTGATSAQLNLGALANNGGSTLTMLPGTNSIAIDKGDPGDHTADQRGLAWVPGTVRSVGALNIAALSVLPVKLLSFSGSSINNQAILLNWATATETNNKGFAVLRSTDNGGTFEQIDFVNSFAQSGNSVSILSYTYSDNTPSNGKNFYRLKQIDLDGNYTYSNVISVELSTQIQLLISPNPTSGTLNVQGAAAGSNYRIFDKIGRTIKAGVNSNRMIDVSGLSAGAYILQIENITGQKQTAKFVRE